MKLNFYPWPGLSISQFRNRVGFVASILILITVAFVQCYRTTFDLHWFYDGDFYRDMAFVQGALDGHFGEDPNIPGAYIWYNPLLAGIETELVKITGLPINIVLARGGTYLNLLGPICFVIMTTLLFGRKIAFTSLFSYLFLATGNIPGYYAATYSPWLYPVCFVQFLFYLNIVLIYKAFDSQDYKWFFALGISTGFTFLGHTAPAVLTILLLVALQSGNMAKAMIQKDIALLRKYFLQGLTVFLPFVVTSSPLLFYIVVKYHLNFANRMPFEYVDTIFIWHNFPQMIRENISVPFLVAVVGFIWFFRNFKPWLIRRIILHWLYISLLMFIYSTAAASIDRHFGVHLPLTVPSYHYFFYLKALQSVFFGFGLVFLLGQLQPWIARTCGMRSVVNLKKYFPILLVFVTLIYMVLYFPVYANREDFTFFREQNILRANEKDKIEIYQFIVQNIPSDKVILCEEGESSIFPVMATARKMVSSGITYSNPYVNFEKRESDRNSMIAYMKTGQPEFARKLFYDYQVNYVLLKNGESETYKTYYPKCHVVYKNKQYTLISVG